MSTDSLFIDDGDSNDKPESSVHVADNHKPPRKSPPRKPKRKKVAAEPAPGPELPMSPVSDDPFDPTNLNRMKLSQDFVGLAAVKPVITSVAVRKPSKHEFVRVRPGAEWRFETGCFVDKDTRETYLVAPGLWSGMPGDVTPTALVLAISRNSPVPFLWPLPLPSSDGRPNRWHESGIEAARIAESQWSRSVADMAAGCYVPFVAAARLPEPEWPVDLQMSDYLRLAFQSRFIRDFSHPALQRLRGEI